MFLENYCETVSLSGRAEKNDVRCRNNNKKLYAKKMAFMSMKLQKYSQNCPIFFLSILPIFFADSGPAVHIIFWHVHQTQTGWAG